ncbi:MAG: prepilin-type N-terminal cleavage/methylation domain-containing protein [Zetaproteobacteria bacterium]|nr:MAG: prepilin-type N-terminal cleavage/methylation domain-containing protein [Zetaproteobacteria bacterium]
MRRSTRMAANDRAGRNPAQDAGVTLIEMMVTIAIVMVLLAIAVGGWQTLQARNRTESAIEGLASAIALARTKAMATGQEQTVEVDFNKDCYRTTAWAGPASGWRCGKGVDLLAATAACAPSTTSGVKTFTFTPAGTVRVSGGGRSYSVMARAPKANPACVIVSNITGRARLVRP